MNDASTGVDDVWHKPGSLVALGADQGFVEVADHDARIIEIEQNRPNAVFVHGSDAVGEDEPSAFGFDG